VNTIEKYRGTVQACTEAVWIRQILGELGLPIHTSTTIYGDNQSAIQVTANIVSHNKIKHAELHDHYLR